MPTLLGMILMLVLPAAGPLATRSTSSTLVAGTPPDVRALGALAQADTSRAPTTPEDITAEVAWGCLSSPAEWLRRAKASDFGPWAQGWGVPKAAVGAPAACVTCAMSLNDGPSCNWRDPNATAATQALAAKRCTELGTQDVFGAIDLATLWQGWLVQVPPSSSWPQISRRLGMGEVTQLCFGGRLRSSKAWQADLLLRAKATPRGLFSTLGPPVAPQLPSDVGLAAAQSLSASVVPSRLWNLLETLAAGVAPLQYTLLRVQLDSIEKDLRIHWADDVLGNKPAVWTLYQNRTGDWVGILDGADGAQAVTFLAAAVEGLADLLPGLQMQVFKKTVTMATLTIPSGSAGNGGTLHLAFLPQRIVVATTAGALTPHLKKHDRGGRAMVLRTAAATVFGTLDAGRATPWLRWLSADLRPPIIKNARGAWFFSPDPQGWRGSVEMTVERQTFGQ